jgi:hypothetical protein
MHYYTGPGVGLGDYLAKEFGEYDPARHKFGKIKLCHFSNTLKLEIFSKLRMAFGKRGLRVSVNRVIREDLHSLNRVSTAHRPDHLPRPAQRRRPRRPLHSPGLGLARRGRRHGPSMQRIRP